VPHMPGAAIFVKGEMGSGWALQHSCTGWECQADGAQ
jgi:hypothetical protein